MAAKELRLAFAMGGGVSLGTFSGAALSEAIKAAVLGAGYTDPDTGKRVRYSRVVVDVFSGASAGAMSLAVMLRALAHRTPEQERAAEEALREELGDTAFNKLDPELRKDLTAAQAVQIAQETIWRDEVHIKHLLGGGPEGKRDLAHIGAIFDRFEVDRIARKFLLFPDAAIANPGEADPKKRRADLSGRRLLGDRVLLACTISNLSAIQVNAASEFLKKGDAGLRGLADAAASKCHAELRVFDLRFRSPGAGIDPDFADETRNPGRWCRYHEGDENQGTIGDLRLVRTWKKIAATAIASGAFPFAFEPVVLTRRKHEFGDDWPFDPKAAETEEFQFSYVDGGTFNNEPIREAFRLSAFADAGSLPDSFDRLVVFVDPFADASAPSYRVPVHREYFFQDPNFLGRIDGFDLERCSSLDRLAPHAGTVLAAIMNESRVNEANRISKTVNRFEQRSAMRAALLGPLTAKPERATMIGLRDFCSGTLARIRKNVQVPPGRMSLGDELDRVILEDGLKLPRDDDSLEDVCTRPDPENIADAGLWQQALSSVALDLVMDMTGKSSAGRLIAITPRLNPDDPNDEPFDLPGGALHGFAGFCSKVNRDYEIRLGKLCTRKVMQVFGLLDKTTGPAEPLPKFSKQEREAFARDLSLGIDGIGARVSKLMTQSHIIQILPGLDNMVLWFVGNYLKKSLRAMAEPPPPTRSFEFRIAVPDGAFELDGRGIMNDVKPVRIPDGGPRFLVTYGRVDGRGRWTGPNFDEAAQVLNVDINGAWSSFCSIELPRPAECDAADGQANPRFELTLDKAADKGKRIGRKRWVADCGVKSLEDVL